MSTRSFLRSLGVLAAAVTFGLAWVGGVSEVSEFPTVQAHHVCTHLGGRSLPPTCTPTPTDTPVNPPNGTETPTGTPTQTASPSPSPSETSTGTPAQTATPTPSPTETPTPTSAPSYCTAGAQLSINCMVFDSDRVSAGKHQVYAMKVNPQPDASTLQLLTTDNPDVSSTFARISPNRSKILFHRTPTGTFDDDVTQVEIWVMSLDGSAPRQIRGKQQFPFWAQAHAEWIGNDEMVLMALQMDPSGQPLAEEGFRIYTIDATTGAKLTAVTDHLGIDPSWSPQDPTNVLYISCESPSSSPPWCEEPDFEIYRTALGGDPAGKPRTRLSTNGARDNDPYHSHQGGPNARVAWVQKTDPFTNFGLGRLNIWVMNANGTGAVNLTRDRYINIVPQWSWSPDDQWIYFHRIRLPLEVAFGIYRISPGGGGITPVLVDGHNNMHPSL